MACDTRERPDGMESCADGINDLKVSLKQTPTSAQNKGRRPNEGQLESNENNPSTSEVNTADEVSEKTNIEVGRQLFEEERKRRNNSKNETVKMLQCNRQQPEVDQTPTLGTERVDSGQLADTISSTDLPTDQRSRVPIEQNEHSLVPRNTTKEGEDVKPSLMSLTGMPIEESAYPTSQLVPSGVQPQDKFVPLVEEESADTLVKCVITNNALLMESMCRHLDRESRVIKCWRHLAYVLKVPPEVLRKFDLYTELSPTEDLFAYLQTSRPQLTVYQLKDLLKKDYRNDLVAKLANFDDGEVVCDLVAQHPQVLTGLASELDMDSRTIGNWKSLAAKCGVAKSKVDEFGMPKHGPTYSLFFYLKKQGSSLTVGQLKGHLTKMQRNDILQLFEEHKGFSDTCLVKDVLEQDSDLLCEVGRKLNKDVRALKGWRNLAYRLKIPAETYNTFDVSKEKKSPTRLLFEWLRTHHADLTIDELLEAVREVQRNDVVEMIRKETESAVKKGFAITEYRKSTASRVHDTLTKMKDGTSGKRSEDLYHNLKENARQKGYQLRCNNPGNGNCMFYALSDQVLRVNSDHIKPETMRENLVQYLEENPKLADGTELVRFVDGHERWSDYLKYMRRDGTWGDNIVLLAAANLFKRPIRVISSLPNPIDIEPVQMPEPHVVNNPMVLGHIAEYHYVSLEPIQEVAPENGQGIPVCPEVLCTGAKRPLPGVNPHMTTGPQIMTLREQKLQMRPSRLPFQIYGKTCRIMDTKRDFFDDFRMLAEELGIDRDDIRWLEQQKNPTEKILIQKENKLTVGGLIQLLQKIEREDVASMLEQWVESEP